MNRNLAFVIAAATTLALLSTAPLVAADSHLPPCSDYPEEEEAEPWSGYYLNTEDEDNEDLGVWEQSNMLTGLQTESYTCEDFFDRVQNFDTDTQLTPPPAVIPG